MTVYEPGAHQAFLTADAQIEGGTSGGAIVDARGELVGIVSHSYETGGRCEGTTPVPFLALPVWAARRAASGRVA